MLIEISIAVFTVLAVMAISSRAKLRCLPVGSDTNLYKDAGCTVPVAQSAQGVAPPPLLFDVLLASQCKEPTHVYTVGAIPITLTEVYVDQGPGGCQQIPTAVGTDYYDVTEIAPTSFAAVSLVQD